MIWNLRSAQAHDLAPSATTCSSLYLLGWPVCSPAPQGAYSPASRGACSPASPRCLKPSCLGALQPSSSGGLQPGSVPTEEATGATLSLLLQGWKAKRCQNRSA